MGDYGHEVMAERDFAVNAIVRGDRQAAVDSVNRLVGLALTHREAEPDQGQSPARKP